MKLSAPPKAEEDRRIFRDVRNFIEDANAAGGTPQDQLSPASARQSLVDAQAAVKADYSGIEGSQRQIFRDGYTIDIHIGKPQGERTVFPCSCFFMVAVGSWATIEPLFGPFRLVGGTAPGHP
jgi:hypothetical protein